MKRRPLVSDQGPMDGKIHFMWKVRTMQQKAACPHLTSNLNNNLDYYQQNIDNIMEHTELTQQDQGEVFIQIKVQNVKQVPF